MKQNINLLPRADLGDLESNKAVKFLRRTSIVIILVLMLVGGAGGGFLFYLSRNLKSEQSKNTDLKQEVAGLESTEQSLVLLRDRLEKISVLLAARDTNEAVVKQNDLLKNASSDLVFRELRVSSNEPYVSLGIADLATTANFLKSLASDENYEKVQLVSLTFDKNNGYEVSLIVR